MVEELSRKIARPLVVAPTLRARLGMLRVRGQSAEAVLERLADAYEAKWVVQSDGTLVLSPDAKLERAREAEIRAMYVNAFRRAVEEERKKYADQPTELDAATVARIKRDSRSPNLKIRQNAGRLAPAQRFLRRIMGDLPEEVVARRSLRGRIIRFSGAGGNDLFSLPAIGREAGRYWKEVAVWESLTKPQELIVRCIHFGDLLALRLSRRDAHGRLKSVGSHFLKIPGFPPQPLVLPRSQVEIESPQPFTNDERVFNQALPESVRDEWRRLLTGREDDDVMNWSPVGMIARAADALNMNIVGSPGDSVATELFNGLTEVGMRAGAILDATGKAGYLTQ